MKGVFSFETKKVNVLEGPGEGILMKPVQLTPLTKEVVIEYTQKLVPLSSKRKSEIEKFWEEINQDGSFYRGEVFHVDSVTEQDDLYKIMLSRTDYAHYLHTVRNRITDEEGCRVVFGAGLVETKDSKFVFGEMANHTAHPGRLQCVGGGLSWEDLKGNYFTIKQNVLRELHEELGIDPHKHIETLRPVYLKNGGIHNSIVILYHIQLTIPQNELINIYQDFTEKLLREGEKPEFQNVICLENKKEAINRFFENDDRQCADYLEPCLRQMAKEKSM